MVAESSSQGKAVELHGPLGLGSLSVPPRPHQILTQQQRPPSTRAGAGRLPATPTAALPCPLRALLLPSPLLALPLGTAPAPRQATASPQALPGGTQTPPAS